jgi:hypothetical protein
MDNIQKVLIKIGKKTKRISLQRYLLSKVIYETDKVELKDIVCLYENQLWLESQSLRDRNFFRKFGNEIYSLSFYLKEADLKGLNRKALRKFSMRIKDEFQGFVVPKRNYSQWKQRFSGRFHLNPKVLEKDFSDVYLKRKSPPKRAIGIGYRDKGSRRNLAKDGSPSWQEVNSATPGIPKWKKDLDNVETIEDIQRIFVEIFPDQDWPRYFAEKRSKSFARDSEKADRQEAT